MEGAVRRIDEVVELNAHSSDESAGEQGDAESGSDDDGDGQDGADPDVFDGSNSDQLASSQFAIPQAVSPHPGPSQPAPTSGAATPNDAVKIGRWTDEEMRIMIRERVAGMKHKDVAVSAHLSPQLCLLIIVNHL